MQYTGSPAPLLVSNYSFLVGRGVGIVGAIEPRFFPVQARGRVEATGFSSRIC